VFDQQVTFLYTQDLERSAAFYGQTLGLTMVLDQGGCRIFRSSANAFVGVCQSREAGPANPDGVIVTFVTEDVDGWYDKLTARGVTFDAPPRENTDYNIYHCFLRDPDGYKIEIQRFQDPSWPAPE